MTREEAIKRIREWNLDTDDMEVLSVVIPELTESEDERIRKEIIDFIQWAEDKGKTRHDYHQAKRPAVWIAYLEKQKEQKLAHFELKVGKWYICHHAFCCRADHLTVKEGERFMCEKDGVVKGFIVKEPEKYFIECSAPAPMEDEQKPSEWSDEEEKFIKHCAELLDEQGEPMCALRLESLYPQKLDASKLENYDPVEILNKIKTECPMAWEKVVGKPEWSEEEKKIIGNIHHLIFEHAFDNGGVDINGDYCKDMYQEADDFIKSLRPQTHKIYQVAKHELAIRFMNYLDDNRPESKMNLSDIECEDIVKAFKENDWDKIMRYAEKYLHHWKPSEEQMKQLEIAADLPEFGPMVTTRKQFPDLESLYEQLKAL